MTFATTDKIRPLTHDQLELVNGGGSFLPIPPYQGGPVHTPVLLPGAASPISPPLLAMMQSGPLM